MSRHAGRTVASSHADTAQRGASIAAANWVSGKAYRAGVIVTNGTQYYIAVKANVDTSLSTSNWVLISGSGALLAANNLSDLTSTLTAQHNLGSTLLQAQVVYQTNQSTTGQPTVEGYTPTNNDIVLLAGQTTQSQNGLWQLPPTGTGGWSRPASFPSGANITGKACYINGGSTNAGTFWALEVTGLIDIDVTAQVWTNEYALLQNLAPIATSGALSSASGTLTLAQLPPGVEFAIYHDDSGGTGWYYPGPKGVGASALITTRPSSRVDLTMHSIGGAAASPPSFELTGDYQDPSS